ncbi:ATP-binding protein [Variovorax sp. HJSM1_2]|uniref:ATP-binding protein n=1 Tax=Variovorax sp. HJSM1_2 TaxID=3366263 RepID=UPI003BD1722B
MNTPSLRSEDAGERLVCRAELASLPALQDVVATICKRGRVSDAECHDLQLIVEEACANVIHHAYPAGECGPLALEVRIVQGDVDGSAGARRMVLTLEDQGKPFDPLRVVPVDTSLAVEARALGGLGVHLIRQLSDHQHYQRSPSRGNVLTLEKYLASPTPAAASASAVSP